MEGVRKKWEENLHGLLLKREYIDIGDEIGRGMLHQGRSYVYTRTCVCVRAGVLACTCMCVQVCVLPCVE